MGVDLKARAKRAEKYRDKLKREGKCANGCGRPRRFGKALCDPCGEEAKSRSKQHVQDKRKLGECVNCLEQAISGTKLCEAHTKAQKQAVWKNAREVKTVLFNHYGGLKCVWPSCPEIDLDVLSLDHVNDNGAEERRALAMVGGGSNFYRWLKKQGYPTGVSIVVHEPSI